MRSFTSPHIRTYHLTILLALVPLLYGCPYSSVYKLDKEPMIETDKSFLGKWATMVATKKGMQPLKLIVSEKNDKEYNINIVGYMDDLKLYNITADDTLKCTAFISTVAKWQFLNMEI